jgi:hypothetical protein
VQYALDVVLGEGDLSVFADDVSAVWWLFRKQHVQDRMPPLRDEPAVEVSQYSVIDRASYPLACQLELRHAHSTDAGRLDWKVIDHLVEGTKSEGLT